MARGAVSQGDACTVHYVERLASNDAVVRDSRARKESEQDDGDREEVRLSAGRRRFFIGRERESRSHTCSFVRSFVLQVPLTFIVGKNTVIRGIESAVGIALPILVRARALTRAARFARSFARSFVRSLVFQVVGMEVGEVKDGVLVSAEDAYGARREDLTATIPKESCPEGMKVGLTVSLSNGLQALVTEEDPLGFTIDANHPLSGCEMKYTIEVVENVPSEQVKEVGAVSFDCDDRDRRDDGELSALRSENRRSLAFRWSFLCLAGLLRGGVLLGSGVAVQAGSGGP